MKTKVLYIFAFMLVLDMLSSCSKPSTYTLKITNALINARNYSLNRTLEAEDAVPAKDLEINIQLEWVQTASNFKIPSLFSTSAYAKSETYYNFSNRMVKVSVYKQDKNGVRTNITGQSNFPYGGKTYATPEEFVAAFNARLDRYGNEDSSTPSLGYKIRFNESIKDPKLSRIRIEMEMTDKMINPFTVLLDIQ